MEIRSKRSGRQVTAQIEGRLEGNGTEEFLEKMRQVVEPQDDTLLLDFSRLSYISSAGLRVIAILISESGERGTRMAAFGMIRPVRAVFEVSGFDQLITVTENAQEALETIGK